MLIGLTGGIGSGKSSVCEILTRDHDITCIEADDLILDLFSNKDGEVFNYIVSAFGTKVLEDNSLVINRDKLRKVMNSSARIHLDSKYIIPAIKNAISKVQISCPGPIIFSTTRPENFCLDRIVRVVTSEEIQISRVISRGMSLDTVTSILDLQKKQHEVYVDYIINNDGDEETLKIHINKMLNDLNMNKIKQLCHVCNGKGGEFTLGIGSRDDWNWCYKCNGIGKVIGWKR